MAIYNISLASVRVIVEMSWPYHFVNLSPEQISERRKLLDLYGFYAWLSPLAIVLFVYVVRLLLAQSRPLLVSSFPTLSRASRSKRPNFFQVNARRLSWILDTPLESDYGTVKVHLIGALYTGWLLFLTTHRTGDDYMHFTKRLGHVAVSQLPFQYLLSIKSPLSPVQVATNLSHESLNPYHRLASRIIHLFLVAHSLLYLNFFFWISALPRRLYDSDVRLGLVSITLLTILAVTAAPPNRQKAYHKGFYVPHAFLSFLLIPAIAAHVPYTRRYIFQNLVIYLFNVASRKFNTETPSRPAIITPVPNTDNALLYISIPTDQPLFGIQIPTWIPGQHMYIKAGDNPKFPRSPFTILSVPPTFPNASEKDQAYHGYGLPPKQFLVRNLGGPTTQWLAGPNIKPEKSGHEHANGHSKVSTSPPRNSTPVLLEGPYGSSSSYVPTLFTALSNPDPSTKTQNPEEILLIAGGVGATYTLPVYISLLTAIAQARQPNSDGGVSVLEAEKRAREMRKKIHLNWIVRTQAEAEWGIDYLRKAVKTLKDGDAIPKHQYRSEDYVREGKEQNGSISVGVKDAEEEEIDMELNVNIHITRTDNSINHDPIPVSAPVDDKEKQKEIDNTEKNLLPSPSPSPTTESQPPVPAPALAAPSKSSKRSPSVQLPTGARIISGKGRPDISSLLLGTSLSSSSPDQKANYTHGKVYVLVCAPPTLSRTLRKEVGKHVLGYGRDVVWCEEGFGMGS